MARPSMIALKSLVDPTATDTEFMQAGQVEGPSSLGAPQWQQHSNMQRDLELKKSIYDSDQFTPGTPAFAGSPNMLQNPVGETIWQNGMANAIDPTGAMGFYASHKPNPKKQAASVAAIHQVMR